MERGRAEVARQAHNLEVVGSNPTPATKLFSHKTIQYPSKEVPIFIINFTVLLLDGFGAHSSVGRAPALQAGGPEFESPWVHKVSTGH